MTLEEQRQKLQALADRTAAEWPDFATQVGHVHVVADGEAHVLFCNGRFSHGCAIDCGPSGAISDESERGGNGPLVLAEMVTKPQYRQPPCTICAGVSGHDA